jgi:hypothetical protein
MEVLGVRKGTQVINGIEYVFEDHAYWDSKKKRGAHKRVYIGKMSTENLFQMKRIGCNNSWKRLRRIARLVQFPLKKAFDNSMVRCILHSRQNLTMKRNRMA